MIPFFKLSKMFWFWSLKRWFSEWHYLLWIRVRPSVAAAQARRWAFCTFLFLIEIDHVIALKLWELDFDKVGAVFCYRYLRIISLFLIKNSKLWRKMAGFFLQKRGMFIFLSWCIHSSSQKGELCYFMRPLWGLCVSCRSSTL